ncbi:hypothetical protein M378DRAFT_165673 [Amanita muscaria Koide BX008]|uniref:Uncharacterized protein n=1 Tax=Amanita muscaria (strain Koide BX008) TaxID=946122 RepID=A0A0C2SH58_AMAMK|nr:hypothetical protein M378DRAFT_165673 [Amanita muscaria Koide BX008]
MWDLSAALFDRRFLEMFVIVAKQVQFSAGSPTTQDHVSCSWRVNGHRCYACGYRTTWLKNENKRSQDYTSSLSTGAIIIHDICCPINGGYTAPFTSWIGSSRGL